MGSNGKNDDFLTKNKTSPKLPHSVQDHSGHAYGPGNDCYDSLWPPVRPPTPHEGGWRNITDICTGQAWIITFWKIINFSWFSSIFSDLGDVPGDFSGQRASTPWSSWWSGRWREVAKWLLRVLWLSLGHSNSMGEPGATSEQPGGQKSNLSFFELFLFFFLAFFCILVE